MDITTFVQHEMNPLFPLSVLLTLIIFGYMAFLICPLVYLVTQNAVHRCSRCLTLMGVKRCFGIPDDLNAPVSEIQK